MEAFRRYVDRVHSVLPQIANEPVLYDSEYLMETVVVPALQVAAVLYVVHFGVVVPFVGFVMPHKSNPNPTARSEEKLSRDKMSFQATCLLVNLIVTIVGFQLEWDERRREGSQDVYHRLHGLDDVAFLPAWQVGVQLWTLPIGLFMINEDSVMLMHHVALIFTAILPCCFRVGFRWHVPFFFGYAFAFLRHASVWIQLVSQV